MKMYVVLRGVTLSAWESDNDSDAYDSGKEAFSRVIKVGMHK